MSESASSALYGLLAEFKDPDALLAVARRAREAGYRRMDAFTPFPVHGLSEEIGFKKTRVSMIVLLGGLCGGLGGYFMQYFIQAQYYPMIIGGKPFHSWPAFIPITFECTILLAALSGVVGMLALNGLPMPYHPLFNVDRFERASIDAFFFCIEAADPKFDAAQTKQFLEKAGALKVFEVAP